MKFGAAAALAVVILIGAASPAGAHADLVTSDPPSGTTLQRAPSVVRLTFSEPVDPAFTRVAVRGTSGFTKAPTSIVAEQGRTLVISLPSLASGPYAITYTTTTTDGHTASGDVLIGVGKGAQLRSLGPADPVGAGAVLDGAAKAARVGWYVALALVVGALAWGWLIPPEEPGSDARRLVTRRVRRVIVIGWAALAAISAARIAVLLASLAAAAPAASLGSIVGRLRPTTAGQAWFVLLDVAVVAGLFVRRDARRLLAAAVVVVSVAEAATGHAALGPHRVASVVAVTLHLLALSLWGGGLLVLASLLMSRRWRALPGFQRTALLNQFFRRFGRLALVSVGVLLATGGVMAWIQLGGIDALTSSDYGTILRVKLVIIAVALPLGAWHRLAGVRRSMPRTVPVEVALVVAVVVAGSVLATETPGRLASASTALTAAAPPTDSDACLTAVIETSECWQRYVTHMTRTAGPEAAIAEVRDLYEKSDVVKGECHQLVHTIGRHAFEEMGDAKQALRFTDPLCNSGYQHGVTEEAIAKLSSEALTTQLPTFCTPVTYRQYSFDHHNCAHGVGHGIATQKKEDVFASTPFCELFADPWETQSCYGGVFMQKVIGDISGASADPHAENPIWPCDVVPEVQKGQCYLISTGRVLRLLDYDWEAAFAVCDNVETNYRETCYLSMGRDISGYTNFEPAPMRDLCLRAGALGPEPCIRGAVQTTVDDEHGPSRGTKLCAIVPAEFRLSCRLALAESLAQL